MGKVSWYENGEAIRPKEVIEKANNQDLIVSIQHFDEAQSSAPDDSELHIDIGTNEYWGENISSSALDALEALGFGEKV